MERKHFVTIRQTVRTRIINISIKKENNKRYHYLIVKLPATFKEQKVRLWNERTNKGKIAIAQALGGSGIIRFDVDDESNFQLGDILTATFSNPSSELE